MSRRELRFALVQFAPRKGDVAANLAAIGESFEALRRDKGSLPSVVVFPETCLSGYFVEGAVREVALSADEALRRISKQALAAFGKAKSAIDVVFGFYEDDAGKLYNSAMYASLGAKPVIRHVHRKMFLPTYGVFDEERFVSRGASVRAFSTPLCTAAILICEDACHSLAITVAAVQGAQVIFVPSASPGRGLEDHEPANVRLWRDLLRVAAAEHGVFVVYAGLLGFEGGKGFTGASRVIGPAGDLRAEAPFDEATILRVDVLLDDVAVARAALPMLGDLEANLPELVAQLESRSGAR